MAFSAPSKAHAPTSGLAPVSDARSVVQSLYPNARITDWMRDPHSALGRANPNSWHTRTGAAVDVAPLSGISYDDYVNGYKQHGYGIIEAHDEQKHPFPWTTGPNWHVVLGKKGR